jgi:hypothetical protein
MRNWQQHTTADEMAAEMATKAVMKHPEDDGYERALEHALDLAARVKNPTLKAIVPGYLVNHLRVAYGAEQ